MKYTCFVVLVIGAAAFVGCASSPSLTVERVGPGPSLARSAPVDGQLLVKPALPQLTTLDDPDFPVRTTYRIFAEDGTLYRTVRGWAHAGEQHDAVSLPAGQYTVQARAAGVGMVAIPVQIEPARTTILCLNGETDARFEESSAELVALPNGAVIGWRARN